MEHIHLASSGGEVVTIHLPQIINRLAAIDLAQLHCSCREFSHQRVCTHTRMSAVRFRQWKNAQARRIQYELCGDQPPDALLSTLSAQFGLDLAADKLILPAATPDRVYIQKDSPLSARYARGCGFGSGGREVQCIDTWPALGILTLAARSDRSAWCVWDPELDAPAFLGTCTLPPLPPMRGQPGRGALGEICSNPFLGIGAGLLDLSLPVGQAQAESQVCFQERITAIGLKLADAGYSGQGAYFPGLRRDGQAVAALALDLQAHTLKTITTSQLPGFSAGIPEAMRSRIAHVHLPWGPAHENSLHAQVLLRHPERPCLGRDEDLVLLTAQFWFEEAEVLPDVLQPLAALAAEVLLRMGHAPHAHLQHARWRRPLRDIAGLSEKLPDH